MNLSLSNFTSLERTLIILATMSTITALSLCIAVAILAHSTTAQTTTPGISSHVLDEVSGLPAANIWVSLYLYQESSQQFQMLSTMKTDNNGRIDSLLPQSQFVTGKYKATFNVEPYFQSKGQPYFYPYVEVTFLVKDKSQHYHVPLLLSPFGFSTYRGS